jgi:hypothetical protein
MLRRGAWLVWDLADARHAAKDRKKACKRAQILRPCRRVLAIGEVHQMTAERVDHGVDALVRH